MGPAEDRCGAWSNQCGTVSISVAQTWESENAMCEQMEKQAIESRHDDNQG